MHDHAHQCDQGRATEFARMLSSWRWGCDGGIACTRTQDAALVPMDDRLGPCLEVRMSEPEQHLFCHNAARFAGGTTWRLSARIRTVRGQLESARFHAVETLRGCHPTQLKGIPFEPDPRREVLAFNGIFPATDMARSIKLGLTFKAQTGSVFRVANLVLREISDEFLLPRDYE